MFAAAMMLTTPSFSAKDAKMIRLKEHISKMMEVKHQKPLAETAFIKSGKKERMDGPSAPKKNPAQELPLSVFTLPEVIGVPEPRSTGIKPKK